LNRIIIKGKVGHNWRLLLKEKKTIKKSLDENREEEDHALLQGPENDENDENE